MSFVALPLTSQEEAEGQMRLEGVGVHLDGAAIEGGGTIELILMIGDVAGVEESTCIVGVGGEVIVQPGRCGLPVGVGNGGFGVGEGLIGRSLGGGGRGLRIFLSIGGGESDCRAEKD